MRAKNKFPMEVVEWGDRRDREARRRPFEVRGFVVFLHHSTVREKEMRQLLDEVSREEPWCDVDLNGKSVKGFKEIRDADPFELGFGHDIGGVAFYRAYEVVLPNTMLREEQIHAFGQHMASIAFKIDGRKRKGVGIKGIGSIDSLVKTEFHFSFGHPLQATGL